jgi:hypothetical protein
MLCWTKVAVLQQVFHGARGSLLGIDTRCPTGHQIFGSDALLDKFSDLMLCWTKVTVRQQVFQVAAGHRHQVSNRSSDFRV